MAQPRYNQNNNQSDGSFEKADFFANIKLAVKDGTVNVGKKGVALYLNRGRDKAIIDAIKQHGDKLTFTVDLVDANASSEDVELDLVLS